MYSNSKDPLAGRDVILQHLIYPEATIFQFKLSLEGIIRCEMRIESWVQPV